MKDINIVAENPQSTVVAEYTSQRQRANSYQSEAALEKAFIAQLQSQGYEYITLTSEDALVANLRLQLESLNNYHFTDGEWKTFFAKNLSKINEGIEEKTKRIQEDYIQTLTRDNGEPKNINLLDKTNIHNNRLQVINQYEAEGTRKNRYDVTILVNGLPLAHVELKRRGVPIQEAFNQINRYQRDSFGAKSALFEYAQIFIIPNGTQTKYYSNTTRSQHIKKADESKTKIGKKTSNSFEFTSWWADANNKPITDLTDFAATFFAKHSFLSVLTKYCVFTSERKLLVMRPYQIVATERILNRIEVSTNYNKIGTVKAGGYIWHTTGSGKTLTSFKTAQLASKLPSIEKVLFVVDRKDLDYQTMKEYDKFEKDAANSNASTKVLKKQLEDPNAHIIITTIQKLYTFIKKNSGHAVFGGHVVIIFDECHRSQFGDMHHKITKTFKKYHLFGFTGTPIFAKNAASAGRVDLKTTKQSFGDKLHTYTIVDAIADKNVLPFRIDYISTFHEAKKIVDTKVRDIDREKALAAPKRIKNIVRYILDHFNQKTKRGGDSYILSQLRNVADTASAQGRGGVEERRNDVHIKGFNSSFAVSSIDVAKRYYAEFKRQQSDATPDNRLKIAIIYSYGVNDGESDPDGVEDENSDNTDGLDASSRDFLDAAICDYNEIFGTNYNTDSDRFQNYYKDVSLRMKNRDIDLLIVVNMFLTGFDATTLNTLWVDKNLRMHGLLQAFSRTNRILNSIKTFGNIVTFRDLEEATNASLALFGDKEAAGVVLLKTFREYYDGYDEGDKHVRGYADMVDELLKRFQAGEPISSEKKKKEFIKLYGAILKLKNILTAFDEFADHKRLDDGDEQDYHSMYIDLYEEFRKVGDGDKENINDDLVFEMELIKQTEINIDYIIELIKQYHESNQTDKELRTNINRAIDSSVELRNKKELIEQFISTLNAQTAVREKWYEFIQKKKKEELDQIIDTENLDKEKTYKFIENSFRDGGIQSSGTAMANILPPMSLFKRDNSRSKKYEIVLGKLLVYFERYFDIVERVA